MCGCYDNVTVKVQNNLKTAALAFTNFDLFK